MSGILTSALAAVLLGAFVGAALFVPFVAASYRWRGGLSTRRLLLWFAALVYFWAIWTYTLLPLPSPDAVRCAGTNVRLGAFLDDIGEAISGPGTALTAPGVLQVVLNVALFVPLGFLLRVLGRRGVPAAGLVGLALSLLVELTQLTGVWGAYRCAYRVFDVDDLFLNTVGAVVGSLLALAVPRRPRGGGGDPAADRPRPVTRRRRAVGMACDGLGVYSVIFSVGLLVQLWLELVAKDPAAVAAGTSASFIGTSVGVGAWLAVVLTTGRSVGDHAVQVRFTRGALPEWLARVVRFAAGAGGYAALAALPTPWSTLALLLLVTTLVLLLVFPDGRALPGAVGGRRVVDEPTRR
ncbi:VanZ family protein [Auraticoccus monumenti]|uniref:VanZ like family protein n=1 Tax=Auraticoccus monumenti TaxID=675864 RepID=A0A1G7A8Q1_9ACTN|nr:VanZ family protein [Auraticoccus monumenti]SDE10435.1 VanZ like family protein [Auraticoccus monumenti]